MNKQFAVSIDVDTIASHLRGYGVNDSTDEDSVYRIAIPRFLEILRQTSSHATFFLIANSAKQHPEILKQIVGEGHEIASHSMTHSLPFDISSEQSSDLELNQSKELLEQLSGSKVSGFRAPSWDASDLLFPALREAGYRYDASLFPSWMLALLRREVQKRSSAELPLVSKSDLSTFFGPATLHQRSDGLFEIPISTALLLRIPYYHSLSYLVPEVAQRLFGFLAGLRNGPLTYIFHAVDFMGLEEDSLDPRLFKHPGMSLSLEEKLNRAKEVFSTKPSQTLASLLSS